MAVVKKKVLVSSPSRRGIVYPEGEECAKSNVSTRSMNERRVTMYSAPHLFCEMHVFHRDVWYETHRWNYGLQQHLNSQTLEEHEMSGEWSKPHLPRVSVTALMWLRDMLRPELVLLDVEADLVAVTSAVVEALEKTGVVAGDYVAEAKEVLLQHVNSKKFVRDVEPEEDALAADADEDAMQILIDDFELAQSPATCIVRISPGRKSRTGFEEKTEVCKNLHARFMCFVVGSSKLSLKGRWQSMRNLQDEQNFLQMAPERTEGVRLGGAMAMLMQDDGVVRTAYHTGSPMDIMRAIDTCLSELHVVPRMMCPTNRGVQARAKRMLQQMSRLTQQDKWLVKQEDVFGSSSQYSIDGLVVALQKFAVPLLAGIAFALVLANTKDRGYERWTGYGHADHDDDDDGGFANATRHHGSGGGDGGHHDDDDEAVNHPTILGLRINGHDITLHFIVNDVLMCLFFGLAAKEIVEAFQPGGSLHPLRRTINPLAATLGGCVVPILTYIALVLAAHAMGMLSSEISLGTYLNGWGIPTATDISIAWVTALCVFGPGHPAINYLLLLAVVDDGLGLIIIALAYPDKDNPLQPQWLGLVLLAMFIAYCLRRLRCGRWSPYVFLAGPVAWLGLLFASLHPSLALVFVVPFIPLKLESNTIPSIQDMFASADSAGTSDDKDGSHHDALSPLHDFEEALKMFVDCFVLFAFGLVNAGVKVDEAGPLTAVVVLALVIGKTAGITAAGLISSKLGYALPAGMRTTDLVCVGFIASVGLTVSLFISGEAFGDDPRLMAQAKMGALLSLGSALVMAIVATTPLRPAIVPAKEGVNYAANLNRRISTFINEEQALGDIVAEGMQQNVVKIHRLEASIEHASKITREENRMIMETTTHAEKRKLIEGVRARTQTPATTQPPPER